MKKYITLFACLLIASMSFAEPVRPVSPSAWDRPLRTDPFLTDFSINEVNVPHRLDISVTMDHSVNYTVKVTFIVYGNWVGIGWDYKEFNVLVNPYNTYKLSQFSLNTNDDPWPGTYDILYMGPA